MLDFYLYLFIFSHAITTFAKVKSTFPQLTLHEDPSMNQSHSIKRFVPLLTSTLLRIHELFHISLNCNMNTAHTGYCISKAQQRQAGLHVC